MGVFRQLGDPLAGAVCLCQHHGATYAELVPSGTISAKNCQFDTIANATTIVSVQIIITERCCVVVNAATVTLLQTLDTGIEIERPFGTTRTTQRDTTNFNALNMMHHATWEVLNPGTYTYYLVNRAGGARNIYGAWIKAIASDCEG